MSTLAAPARCQVTFRHRASIAWMFVGADVAALELALFLGIIVRQGFAAWLPVEVRAEQYRGLALGILILPLAYYLVGLYPGYGLGGVERLRGRVYSTFVVFCVLITWNFMLQDISWSRGILLTTLFFALWLPPIAEHWAREFLTRNGWCGIPVVVLGAGDTGALVARTLRSNPSLGFVPIALFDDNSSKWNTEVEGVPVLGPIAGAAKYRGDIHVAILAMPSVRQPLLTSLLHTLSFPQVIVIPDLIGMQSLWVSPRDLGGVLGLEVKKNLLISSNRTSKRLLDLVLGLPLFAASLPVLAIAALWIKRVSPGTAFYFQEREGSSGAVIRVWKLRTMYPDAEALLTKYLARNPMERDIWNRFFKLKNDPRILPGIGRFLRRSSLDELPQLWNVLKGEMSLVGPRPFPRYHQESFPSDFRTLRCSVPPGLTGLWQVSARSDGDLLVQEALDTYYIRNWSPWLDLHILARTVMVLVRRKGAY